MFTDLTIDPSSGTMNIEGRKSNWVVPAPAELNYIDEAKLRFDQEIAPKISRRKIIVGPKNEKVLSKPESVFRCAFYC